MKKILAKKAFLDPAGFTLNGASNPRGVLMRFVRKEKDIENGDQTISASFSFPPVFAFADDGKVSTDIEMGQKIVKEYGEKIEQDEKKAFDLKLMFILTGIIAFVYVLYTIFAAHNILAAMKFFGILMIARGAAKAPQYWRDIWARVIKKEDFMSFCRVHAAEHMAMNAYNVLGKVPDSVQDMKAYSIHSRFCNYYHDAGKCWLSICIGILWLLEGMYLLIAAPVLLVLTIIMGRTGFIPLGFIYVAKPTDLEIEVAYTALKEAVRVKEESIFNFSKMCGDAADNLNIVIRMGVDEQGRHYPIDAILTVGDELPEFLDKDK